MKFLCDQCKAKYQIDDAKVAGKTVRMKCRKCGHVIEIRAAVTESSQATKERSMSLGQQPGIAAPPPRRNTAPARPSTAPNALSTAFQKNVASDPPPAGSQPPPADPASDDEWYVAINGVPVGPIGMSELRRKAASGLVTETSLAWREGLEEWRVVRAIPELASLLREATGSLRPGASASTRSSVRPPAPRDPGPSLRPSKPPPRNNVIPLRGAPGERNSVSPAAASLGGAAGAAALQEDLQTGTDPFAAPSSPFTAADPFAAPSAAQPAAAAVAPAAVAPAAVAAPAPMRASSHSLAPLAPAKKPTPWGPIAMVAAAVAFGAAGGLAFFINRNQPVVTVPGPTQTIIVQVPGAPVAPTGSAAADPVASASASAKPGSSGAVAAGPKPTASATATAGGAANLAGLLGGGPSGPSGPGASGGGGGSSLTQQDIENTVRNYQPGVKRRCWDSAQQTSSVNVMASVTVGGDGAVRNVSASGNDSTIARCIETQIRGWRFPATGGTSQFNVPFKFVRQ